jgi:hypothetical protein
MPRKLPERKLVFVGARGAGKTALIQRLATGTTSVRGGGDGLGDSAAAPAVASSIGGVTTIEYARGSGVALQLWDTNGESPASFGDSFFAGTDCVVFVLDATSPPSMAVATRWAAALATKVDVRRRAFVAVAKADCTRPEALQQQQRPSDSGVTATTARITDDDLVATCSEIARLGFDLLGSSFVSSAAAAAAAPSVDRAPDSQRATAPEATAAPANAARRDADDDEAAEFATEDLAEMLSVIVTALCPPSALEEAAARAGPLAPHAPAGAPVPPSDRARRPQVGNLARTVPSSSSSAERPGVAGAGNDGASASGELASQSASTRARPLAEVRARIASAAAEADAAYEREAAALFAKCEVDPVKAQDDALVAIALRFRAERERARSSQTVHGDASPARSVGESGGGGGGEERLEMIGIMAIEEARTTMVRCNYAPDWNKARWDHPLLAGLRELSPLSTVDMPSVLRHAAVAEHLVQQSAERKARVGGSGSNGASAAENDGDADHEQQRQQDTDQTSVTFTRAEDIPARVVDPVALQHAMAHGVNAVFETSAFLLRQTALLDLSSETISGDPQLLALVSAVAQANKNDPVVAGRVALGETPTIPVTVMLPSMRNTVPVRRKACDALPAPGPCNYKRGFFSGDIDASELVPAHPPPKSMHDVGYRTWMQRHLDEPSEHEDRERFAAYRDEVTSLEGRCRASIELARSGGARQRIAGGKQAVSERE